jgi:hypothetical protein
MSGKAILLSSILATPQIGIIIVRSTATEIDARRPTVCRLAARRRDRYVSRHKITTQNAPDLVAQGASAATAGWVAH